MTVVYLSFAGAEPRESSHVVEWGRRLRSAGFDVIDHERFTDYNRIMRDLAACDAVVALVRVHGSTWASIEHTSAVYGRDTMDGAHGTWSPKPTLLWFDPAPGDDEDPFARFPYLIGILASGRAARLPDDFEAAVERAILIIAAIGGHEPTT